MSELSEFWRNKIKWKCKFASKIKTTYKEYWQFRQYVSEYFKRLKTKLEVRTSPRGQKNVIEAIHNFLKSHHQDPCTHHKSLWNSFRNHELVSYYLSDWLKWPSKSQWPSDYPMTLVLFPRPTINLIFLIVYSAVGG